MKSLEVTNKIDETVVYTNYSMCLRDAVAAFTKQLINNLFDVNHLTENAAQTRAQFLKILERLSIENGEEIWNAYESHFTEIRQKLDLDAEAAHKNDPAAKSLEEIYLAYPGFYAIAIYRLAHELYEEGFPLVPRLMTEYAHRQTGVDINPGAQIGNSFFIDHATGVVIGETAVIKDHVKIYQGVTLGALYVEKSLQNVKRHPTIESNVTIYANATILGGETVIGSNSIIGGNAWLTASVPPNSTVFHTPEIKIKTVSNA